MNHHQKETDTDANAAGPSVSPVQSSPLPCIMIKVINVTFDTRFDYLIWVEMYMVLESLWR